MDLTKTFNEAAGGPSGEATAAAGPTPGPDTPNSGHVEFQIDASQEEMAAQTVTVPPPMPHIEEAEAELELLENGRATPELRHNLNPRTMPKKIVDTTLERQREARIRALSAYLDFSRSGVTFASEHELDDGPELCL